MAEQKAIHKEGFIGYKCDNCNSEVWFPLISDTNDRWESLVWNIYNIKLNDEIRLCWICKFKNLFKRREDDEE